MTATIRTPVIVMSGFLGSGKTTLLRNLLAHPHMGESAVIVNEFGEVGLDHFLVRKTDERTVLLNSGCICCSMRGDLAEALRDLLSKRTRGVLPRFERVVVETTGLADPVPILRTLVSEPVVRNHFELQRMVTTVDAVHGKRNLDAYPAAVRQVTAADVVAVTKQDLVPSTTVVTLKAQLQTLNPAALILDSSFGVADIDMLLAPDGRAATPAAISRSTMADEAVDHAFDASPDHLASQHIRSHCIIAEQPLNWQMFAIWLTMLLHRHGDQVLRIKGLLNVGEERRPLVLQGVQHVMHAPRHLPRWPDSDRRSRIVFIVRDMDPQQIEASFDLFQRLATA